jgi:HlyD family secretion protein
MCCWCPTRRCALPRRLPQGAAAQAGGVVVGRRHHVAAHAAHATLGHAPGGRYRRCGRRRGPTRQVWVLKDGVAQAVNVQVGISDGRMTEVSGEAWPGMAVITDQRSAGAAP